MELNLCAVLYDVHDSLILVLIIELVADVNYLDSSLYFVSSIISRMACPSLLQTN